MLSHKFSNPSHSALIRNLIKLKGTAKLTVQDEQVWLKDSKYILFEILEIRHGRAIQAPASQISLIAESGLLGQQELGGAFMSYVLGFQTKYILNP